MTKVRVHRSGRLILKTDYHSNKRPCLAYGGLGVCGDICFVHELADRFCVSSFVAIIVDVDMKPVGETIRDAGQ